MFGFVGRIIRAVQKQDLQTTATVTNLNMHSHWYISQTRNPQQTNSSPHNNTMFQPDSYLKTTKVIFMNFTRWSVKGFTTFGFGLALLLL